MKRKVEKCVDGLPPAPSIVDGGDVLLFYLAVCCKWHKTVIGTTNLRRSCRIYASMSSKSFPLVKASFCGALKSGSRDYLSVLR